MEFEDGRIQRLTGEDAERWLTAADAQCTIGWVHGMPFPSFEWEIVQEGSTPVTQEAATTDAVEEDKPITEVEGEENVGES